MIEGNAELLFENGRVGGIKAGEREIPADQVLVTAGAWANELLAPLGINFLVTYQRRKSSISGCTALIPAAGRS